MRKPAQVRLGSRKLVFELLPDWHGASKLIYVFRDDFEPDVALLPKFLSAGATMIDVGANYGIYSLAAGRLVGAPGKVFAFEPTQRTFAVLEKNLVLNGLRNVHPVRKAVSDVAGKARLYHDIDPTRNSLGGGTGAGDFEEVEVTTLDAFVRELALDRLDFLKIDVEGADELVCKGGRGVLENFKPAVLFEHNPEAAARINSHLSGTQNVLAGLGYEFHRFEDGQLIRVAAAQVPEGNILALHPQGAKPA